MHRIDDVHKVYDIKVQPKLRIRPLSPLGSYPRSTVNVRGARLVVAEDLSYVATEIRSEDRHGASFGGYKEVEFLSLEETRFLAAVMLSNDPEQGQLDPYPLPLHVDFPLESLPDDLDEAARAFMRSMPSDGYETRGMVLPPLIGGPAYNRDDYALDTKVLVKLIRGAPLSDYLAVRGLGAFLGASMLTKHREFWVAGIVMLHVALDATFEIVREGLRAEGNKSPSALDAGQFVDKVFGNKEPSGPYFQDWYADRVMGVHTASRFGTTPFAPFSHDDYFDLRPQVAAMFAYLLANHVWPDHRKQL
jgi:hypothetical protein